MPDTLYERTETLLELEAMIGDADGVVSPELEAAFDAATGSFEDKIIACTIKLKEIIATRKLLAERRAGISKREKALESQADWLDNYIRVHMTKAGRPKVEDVEHKATIILNPVKVEIVEDPETVIRDPEAINLSADEAAYLATLIHVEQEHTVTVPASYAWDKKKLTDAYKVLMADPDGWGIVEQSALNKAVRFTRGTRLSVS